MFPFQNFGLVGAEEEIRWKQVACLKIVARFSRYMDKADVRVEK